MAGSSRSTSDALAGLEARVAARYRSGGRFARHYVAAKLRADPVARAILRHAGSDPLGAVVDLGCGYGQLGLTLLEAGRATSLTGLDWDEVMLADAGLAAAGLPAAFETFDLRSVAQAGADAALPEGDTVLLIDVLHYLAPAAQLALLRRAAASARHRLFLRVFDPQLGWRSRINWLVEAALWLSGRYRRGALSPQSPHVLLGILREAGFAVSVEPAGGRLGLPNLLMVARRTS